MLSYDEDGTRSLHARGVSPRGMTLIELMIVVAIVGVLAAMAGVTYTKYLRKGKIARLDQYAMEVKKGQEQFKARNGTYYNIGCAYYADCGSDGRKKWEEYLEFAHPNLENTTVRVYTDAGGSSDSCNNACTSEFSPNTDDGLWYAVKVTQDLNPASSDKTIVYTDSETETTITKNEGE